MARKKPNQRSAPEKAGLAAIGAADELVETARRKLDELAERGERTVRRVRRRAKRADGRRPAPRTKAAAPSSSGDGS